MPVKEITRETRPFHGQFMKDTKNLKTIHSLDWLARGDLKQETDPFLVGEAIKVVTHIMDGCKMLTQEQYKRHHIKVWSHLHWNLCLKYSFEVNAKWYRHEPETVKENDNIKSPTTLTFMLTESLKLEDHT